MTTPRTHTPDVITTTDDGHQITTIRLKRACNGCGQLLGDATEQEAALAVAGQPLPDARTECPTCAPTVPAGERYCTGDRCADCTPDEECCEATCGCCPRVDEHDHCFLHSGSEEDSQYCDQHGEGWLFDRSPEAQRMYELLRRA